MGQKSKIRLDSGDLRPTSSELARKTAASGGKVGAAARKFMDKYFHDSDYMGRVFVEPLVEVADAGQAPLKPRKPSASFA